MEILKHLGTLEVLPIQRLGALPSARSAFPCSVGYPVRIKNSAGSDRCRRRGVRPLTPNGAFAPDAAGGSEALASVGRTALVSNPILQIVKVRYLCHDSRVPLRLTAARGRSSSYSNCRTRSVQAALAAPWAHTPCARFLTLKIFYNVSKAWYIKF